jgi:hypothetical protein
LKWGFGVLRLALWGIACLVLAISGGCSKSAVKEVPLTYQHLKLLSRAYILATDDLGHPPTNRDELFPYVKKQGDPEKILRSSDDNEEFVILYGVDYHTQPPPVTIYEKKGNGGKRHVVRVRDIYQMSGEDFKKAPFPEGHKAPI